MLLLNDDYYYCLQAEARYAAASLPDVPLSSPILSLLEVSI